MSNERIDKSNGMRVRAFLRGAEVNLDQKRVVLIFRWLLILVVIALMFSAENGTVSLTKSLLLAGLFMLTNVALSFVPLRFFGRLVVQGPMLVVDIALVTAAIYASGNLTSDLYFLYLLTIFLAALNSDIRTSVLSSLVVILLYGGISSWQMDANQFLTTNFLLKIPFFLLTAVFSGFLVSQARLREKEKEETARSNVLLQKELEKAQDTEERTREELWEQYQHNENVLESLNTGVLVIGSHQIVTTFNAEASRVTGLPKDSVVGKPLGKVPELTEFNSLLTKVTEEGRVCAQDEIAVTTPGGRTVPIGISTAVLHDSEQNPCGAIAIFKDLTERKEMKRKLKRSEHMALLGEMAASVAHEIRNPLNSIWGFAQLIVERTEEGDKRKLFAQVVIEESQRIERIVNDTLVFSREGPKLTDSVDISEVIASSVAALSEKAEKASVKIDLDLDPNLSLVKGSKGQLEQVFGNLILNAIQAMPEGGDVYVATGTRDGWVEATVRDTGPGIAPEIIDKIFLPFITTKQDGTGLGLPVCHRIIEDHGGNIEVESEPGYGATFKVAVPVFRNAHETRTETVSST
ncbi:MAG: ATP-binding protein [Candidatus Eisenbacteria bacterium]|nr:ATP-binding protein [Candidatus Eisenbacteria bacterium]